MQIIDFLERGDFVDLTIKRLERFDVANDMVRSCLVP